MSKRTGFVGCRRIKCSENVIKMNVGIDIRRYGEFAFKIYDLLSCYFCGKAGAYLFKFTISYINVLQAVLAF